MDLSYEITLSRPTVGDFRLATPHARVLLYLDPLCNVVIRAGGALADREGEAAAMDRLAELASQAAVLLRRDPDTSAGG